MKKTIPFFIIFDLTLLLFPAKAHLQEHVCYGGSHTFNASSIGTSFSYKWQTSPSGQTNWTDGSSWSQSTSYTLTNITTATDVRCLCDTNGDLQHDTIIFTSSVSPYPQITPPSIAADNISPICHGSEAPVLRAVTAAAGGDGIFTYQWQKQVAGMYVNIIGATADTLSPGQLTATTTYRLVASSSCGVVNSTNSITIQVYDALHAGTLSAANTLLCHSSGTTVSFGTSPSGGGGSYQYRWQHRNGGAWSTYFVSTSTTSISTGALTDTVEIRAIVTSTAGCSSDTTPTITIAVLPPFVAGTIAGADTVCHNTAPSGLVAVTPCTGGVEPYSYQWQKSTNGSVWDNIPSAVSGSGYAPGNLTESTMYRLRYTSSMGCGTAYSDSVTVMVYDALAAPVITSQSATPICYDSTPKPLVISQAAAGGNGLFNHQWQRQEATGWTDIGGENGTTCTPPALTADASFRVLAISQAGCGTIASGPWTFNVWGRIDAGSLADDTVCYGNPATLIFSQPTTGGGGSYTWTWAISDDGITYLEAGSTTTANYTSSPLTTDKYFKAIAVSNIGCSSDTTNAALIAVRRPFARGMITGDDTICHNTSPDALVMQTPPSGGALPYQYQWQQSADGSAFTDITGETGTVTVPQPLTHDMLFRLRITSAAGCGILYSDTVAVSVLPEIIAPALSSASVQSICYDSVPQPILRTSAATGADGLFSYRWQQDSSGLWIDISSVYDTLLQPPALRDTTQYRIVATSLFGCGDIPSVPVSVNVWPRINAGTLSPVTVCYNTSGTVGFMQPPSGGGQSYTYTWQHSDDGVDFLDMFTSLAPTLGTGDLTDTTHYRVIVTSLYGCSSDTTSPVSVDVRAPFERGLIEAMSPYGTHVDTICHSALPSMMSMTAAPAGGATPYHYQWQRAGAGGQFDDIAQETDTVLNPLAITSSSMYRLRFTSSAGCGTLYSDTVFVHVFEGLSPATITSSTLQTICYDSVPQQLYATNFASGADGRFSYQWQVMQGDTWADVPQMTDFSYQPPALGDTTSYRLLATSLFGCGSTPSDAFTFNVWPKINAGMLNPATICYQTDTTLTFLNTPSGGGNSYQYQWQSSDNNQAFSNTGLNADTLHTPILDDTMFYRVIVVSMLGCAQDTTPAIALNVRPLFEPGVISPDLDSACYGFRPSHDVRVVEGCRGGEKPYTYQWFSGSDSTALDSLGGETATILTPGAIYETTHYQLKFISAAGCGTQLSNVHTVKMNPLPPVHIIRGEESVCYNQYETYTLPTSSDRYTYSWSTLDGNGQMTMLNAENDSVEILWLGANIEDTILVTVMDNTTKCISYNKKTVITGSETSPERTVVVHKPGSNILVCKESDENLFYRWGYTVRATGEDSIIAGSNRRYVLLPHVFDTLKYDYWVELLPSANSKCYSRSHYLPSNDELITPPADTKVVVTTSSPNTIEVKISGPDVEQATIQTYNISGVRIDETTREGRGMIEYQIHGLQPHAVYLLHITVGQQVFNYKTIVL